ncbi:MAG: arylesterase [Candidatus Gracilibacteria bacterium]|nr:arylesterase [Candidatus Gracilibacteria bacterium]
MKKIFILFLTSFLLLSCNSHDEQSNNQTGNNKLEQKKTILALGDSLTAGLGVDVSENYPSKLEKKLAENGYNYKIVNAGISGDTSDGLKSRVGLYLDLKPEIVILVIGGNDGLRGLSTTNLKSNIIEIIDSFPSTTKIVLGGMDIPINLGLKYRKEFKNVYTDIKKEKENIYLMDYFLEGVGGVRDLNISDKIHPNSAGYDLIVNNLYNFLIKNNILEK